MRCNDQQHFLIDNTKYEFVAVSNQSSITNSRLQEKVIHEKKLSAKSGLMSTVLLINIDILSLSLIFSTDTQEPSHTHIKRFTV